MKTLYMEQGSPEWRRARLGIVTASNFNRVITPKTLELKATRGEYMTQLLAEWLTGDPWDGYDKSGVMIRGSALEQQARKWYEFDADVSVEQVGLCLRDDELVACSPDGLVDEDGGLEIKCPMAPKCVSYLLGIGEALSIEHRLQIQGAMWITGRAWWDIIAFNPFPERIAPTRSRVQRDDVCIAAIANAIDLFVAELKFAKELLIFRGCESALEAIA